MQLVRFSLSVFCVGCISLSACTRSSESEAKYSLPKTEGANSAQSDASSSSASAVALNATLETVEAPKVASVNNSLFSTSSLRISGNVMAGKQSQISFNVGGRTARIIAKVGDKVKKGQILAELDDTDFLLRQRLAKAATEQAKIQASQAQKDLLREEQLKKENVTSQSNVERVFNAQASASIGLEISQINFETAQKAVADTKLLSPFDGIIVKKYKSEGEWVAAGASVFEVVEYGNIEVSLRVPETFLKKIEVGKNIKVSNPATNTSSKVKIVRVVPIVQEASRTFEVIGVFTENNVGIVPGQFVEAEIN